MLIEDEEETAEKIVEGKWIMHAGVGSAALPEMPNNFEPEPPKIQQNEPVFHAVDNPEEWPEYVFWPKFKDAHEKGQCLCRAPPTGATPVPKHQIGKRMINQ